MIAAAAIVASQWWHGPIVLSLSSSHGIDSGDLVAFPVIVLAVALAHRFAPHRSWRRLAPVSAIVLGVLLLLAGIVTGRAGGSLVPVGGGTFDGTIWEAGSPRALPVDRWSYLAVTYDGDAIRLFIDGRQVAHRPVSGTIQRTPDPLWIGGNLPYGEHFDGRIDEVRVYGRALRPTEIRQDMARPVAPAAGLVAAYGFDAGAGRRAADASGAGNTGRIEAARWARGRYGRALAFNGADSVVRVPPSASLDLSRAMTLSGWVDPSAPQRGWRTVVQRQTNAYILTAGSSRQETYGRFDDVRAALIVAAFAWCCVLLATSRTGTGRRRRWWWGAGLLLGGLVIDVAIAPTPALVGPMLVALWLAATAPNRGEKLAFLAAGVACGGVTLASLSDVAGLADALSRDDGSVARTMALGALLVLAGAARLAAPTRP